jgi:hypothetical protein
MPYKTKEEKKVYHQEYYQRLKSGEITARGTRPVKYISGQKFNHLIAVRFSHRQGFLQKPYWEFQCDLCGSLRIMDANYVKSGKTKACGCRSNGRTVRHNNKEEVAFRNMYNTYKFGAKNRNLTFELSHEEFHDLTKRNCVYCGTEPIHERKSYSGKYRPVYLGNGVDRIDNFLGYTKDNSAPCCSICNHAKHTMSATEFIAWLDRVAKFRTPQNLESPAFMQGNVTIYEPIRDLTL